MVGLLVKRPIRVLLAKPTQDCHDRGVRYLARMCRNAGFETVFTNFLLASEIAATAVDEDVDIIGISSSSGGHMEVFEDLVRALTDCGRSDIPIIGGGVIPDEDVAALKKMGVKSVFGPGSSAEQAVDFIREAVKS